MDVEAGLGWRIDRMNHGRFLSLEPKKVCTFSHPLLVRLRTRNIPLVLFTRAKNLAYDVFLTKKIQIDSRKNLGASSESNPVGPSTALYYTCRARRITF